MIDTHRLSEQILQEVELPQGSELPVLELIDKIKGIIYGNALGDAIGVRTEFLESSKSREIWLGQEYSLLGWKEFINNSRFPEGDWTDDTDQMILILMSYLEQGGINPIDFALKLRNWRYHGFPELGDTIGLGCGFTVSRTLSHKLFLKNPSKAAFFIWTQNHCDLAANGALMRTSILGIINYKDLRQVIQQTLDIAMTTHTDPRSLASCIALTTAVALVLQGVRLEVIDETAFNISAVFIDKYTEIIESEIRNNCQINEINDFDRVKEDGSYSAEVLRKQNTNSFEDLLPLDQKNMGYTYKCLSCGFWAFKQNSWMPAMSEIILQGGDADTNAAVAGALLGAKLGFGSLPQNLIEQLRHKPWLDEKFDALLVQMKIIIE